MRGWGVSSGIGDQQKPSLPEVLLDLSNESPLSPEAAANVSTANWPGEVLEETRFSMPRLTFFYVNITTLKMYCSIWKTRLVPWVPTARNLRTSPLLHWQDIKDWQDINTCEFLFKLWCELRRDIIETPHWAARKGHSHLKYCFRSRIVAHTF